MTGLIHNASQISVASLEKLVKTCYPTRISFQHTLPSSFSIEFLDCVIARQHCQPRQLSVEINTFSNLVTDAVLVLLDVGAAADSYSTRSKRTLTASIPCRGRTVLADRVGRSQSDA